MKHEPVPMVSVLVPVFNGARFLRTALDSVIGQNYPNLEIVVVDDGSEDNSAEVMREYAKFDCVQCHHIPHSGVSAARNRALEMSRGSLIAFLDSDDLWLPEKLHEQVAYIGQHRDCDIVFTLYKNIVEHEYLLKQDRIQNEILAENKGFFYLMTSLARRELFEKCGGFNESLEIGEDTELTFRMWEIGVEMGHRLNRVYYHRRLHGQNTVLTTADYAQKMSASQARNLRLRHLAAIKKKKGTDERE